MFDNFIKLVIGDLDKKREYKQLMKRVDELPQDYKYAFKKIQKYMYTVGSPNKDITIFTDMTMFTDLVELFETSAADKRQIIDVIGRDIDKFSDEFMSSYTNNSENLRDRLNRDIMEKFNKEGW